MAVSNPLYRRICDLHPTRPKIGLLTFVAVLEEWGTGTLTAAQANTIIGQVSQTQDPNTGAPIPVPLDASEQQEANDLWGTINGLGQAQQAGRLLKVQAVLHLLENGGGQYTGYGPDDMAGTLATAGGKLNVKRIDAP